jgi:hypothetical protein
MRLFLISVYDKHLFLRLSDCTLLCRCLQERAYCCLCLTTLCWVMLRATTLVYTLQRDLASFSTAFDKALLRSRSQPSCSSSGSTAQAATPTDDAAVGSDTASDSNDVLQLLEAAVTARQKVPCTGNYTSKCVSSVYLATTVWHIALNETRHTYNIAISALRILVLLDCLHTATAGATTVAAAIAILNNKQHLCTVMTDTAWSLYSRLPASDRAVADPRIREAMAQQFLYQPALSHLSTVRSVYTSTIALQHDTQCDMVRYTANNSICASTC